MDHLRGSKINHKLLWKAFAIALAVGFLICAAVNLFISHEFTWSLYVAGSSLLALGIISALFFGGKHRLLLSLAVLAVLIMPFLMLVEHLSSGGNWAWPVGLPIAAIALVVLLLGIVLFQYTRINNWYCSSITVLASLAITLVSNHVAAQHSSSNVSIFNMITNVLSHISVSAVLLFVGKKAADSKG